MVIIGEKWAIPSHSGTERDESKPKQRELHLRIRLKRGVEVSSDPLNAPYHSNPYLHASGHAGAHILLSDLALRIKGPLKFDAGHLRYCLGPLIDRCDRCAGRIFEYRLQRVNYTNPAARVRYIPPPGDGAIFSIADCTINTGPRLIQKLTLKCYSASAAIREVSAGRSPGLGLYLEVILNECSSKEATRKFFESTLGRKIDCGSRFFITGKEKEIVFRILDDQNVFPASCRPVFDAISKEIWEVATMKARELEYEPFAKFGDVSEIAPYPGRSGDYSEMIDSPVAVGVLDHKIRLIDSSSLSFIKNIDFLFDKDGSIRLMATIEESSFLAFKNYLLAFGVDVNDASLSSFIHITGQEVKRAWEVIRKHNTFLAETKEYIDAVLEKGNWKGVHR